MSEVLGKVITLLLFAPSVLYGQTGPVNGGKGYHINHGDSAVIDKHGFKKKVINNHASGLTIFVPLNTQLEWTTYIDKPPPGVTVEDVLNCPVGYIPVPGNPDYNTEDFCVAKYEMKNVGGQAKSQAAGVPWVNISRNSSRTRCSEIGTGYSLITNAQWQTIARNIVTVAVNWSEGSVGSGALNKGHTDNSPAANLDASHDDNDPCYKTEQTCSPTVWDRQRRTHVLSNGEVIWDFGGNVAEWVYDDYGSLGVNPSISVGYHDCNTLSENNRKLFCPSDPTWDRTYGIGQVFGGSGGALYRGGDRYWGGVLAGIFRASLDGPPTGTADTMGFRCVWKP